MKPWPTNTDLLVIESTDLYYNEVHKKWFPVPKHWIGDFVDMHTDPIMSGKNK
jgi:hypothetical protein